MTEIIFKILFLVHQKFQCLKENNKIVLHHLYLENWLELFQGVLNERLQFTTNMP